MLERIKVLVFQKFQEFAYFIWLILLVFIAVFVTYFYDNNKKNQIYFFEKTINNIFFQKSLEKIASELTPRFLFYDYEVNNGDTYETIIGQLNLPENEKKLFLETVKKNKNLKILRLNQKISFKIDRKNYPKILEFKIELDKKKDALFKKTEFAKEYYSEIIEKTLEKFLIFKEGSIESSLYSTAINLGIKPNIIVEFARLYGFQVDFQRDIWKGDSFQIIYEEYKNNEGTIIEIGDIIYASLNLQNNELKLYKFEHEENQIDYFDENGKSMRKTLMKTPINGARLSSSFGKRKHPILGFTKMHSGTDFAAPTGTPIMASGDGIVLKAGWCGGGGNCVKLKHNSVYQTVYAHMSKIGRGVKKGARVKQGQIIGYAGSTGLSTGPHLHYEIIYQNKHINPLKLKLPSGKILKGKERKLFETNKIKLDVLKSEKIIGLN